MFVVLSCPWLCLAYEMNGCGTSRAFVVSIVRYFFWFRRKKIGRANRTSTVGAWLDINDRWLVVSAHECSSHLSNCLWWEERQSSGTSELCRTERWRCNDAKTNQTNKQRHTETGKQRRDTSWLFLLLGFGWY